jgi:hypothetical protein
MWAFECKPIPVNKTDLICQYNNNVNDLDQPMEFDVSNEGY